MSDSATGRRSTTGSDSTTGVARASRPVHDNEGQTLAAWTACGGIIAASLVAAAAVILGSIPLTVAAFAVAAAGLIVGGLLERARRARHGERPAGAGDDGPAGAAPTDARPGGPTHGVTVTDGTRPYDRESDDH